MKKIITLFITVLSISAPVATQAISDKESLEPVATVAEKTLPCGFMLRALPGMKVRPQPGTRSTYVPPVKGVDGTLVFAEWADMQSEEFGAIKDENIVDRALVAVEEWNEQHPEDQVYLRLRTLSGIYAPAWVMKYADSVDVDYRETGAKRAVVRTTPKFWTPEYFEAWRDFQTKLAAKYDGHPLIKDVSISGCMTLHTEVMWRQFGNPYVLPALAKTGLTQQKDLACLKEDITLFMEVWRRTPVEMTFNTRWQFSYKDGELVKGRRDPVFAKTLLDHMARESERLDKLYMVGNHSLSEYSVLSNKKYEDEGHILYALNKECRDRNTPLYFQTEVFTSDIVERLLEEAIGLGASLVELPNDIAPDDINTPELQAFRRRLQQQASKNR
jgi:hypothetical protein